MDRDAIYRLFPDEVSCIAFLEGCRWGEGRPQCPHCNARKASAMPAEHRHHCNGCGVSFSVTCQSFMHRTRADRRQWLLALMLVTDPRIDHSVRSLAEALGVNKGTASLMRTRIVLAQIKESAFVNAIIGGLFARLEEN